MIIWIRNEWYTHFCRKFISNVCALLIFQQRKLLTTLPIFFVRFPCNNQKYGYKGNTTRGLKIIIIRLLTAKKILPIEHLSSKCVYLLYTIYFSLDKSNHMNLISHFTYRYTQMNQHIHENKYCHYILMHDIHCRSPTK